MNTIAGPATGLDMLLQMAGMNPANAAASSDPSFEAALGVGPEICRGSGDDSGQGMPFPLRPPRKRNTPSDIQIASTALPLPPHVLPGLPADGPIDPFAKENARQASTIRRDAQHSQDQATAANTSYADVIPVNEPGRARGETRITMDDTHSSRFDDVISPRSEPTPFEPVHSRQNLEAQRQSSDQSIPTMDEESLGLTEAALDSVHSRAPALALRNNIIDAVRMIVNRPDADRPLRRMEGLSDRFEAHANRAVTKVDAGHHAAASFDLGTTESPPPVHSELIETPATSELEPATLIDELASEPRTIAATREDVVVELQIPEWGVLEIEVTREGDATEVSLLADPELNHLIRDHLPELTEALSASGIELTGLDVRQHEHERHGQHDALLAIESRVGEPLESQPNQVAARTGLSRYRQMSITA
jgi:hypothetical protein